MAYDLTAFAERLKRLPEELEKAVNSNAIDVGQVIVETAKSSHSFNNRTGRLESSIKAKYTSSGVEAYLDTGVAKYAGYVHDGTKYMSPDPFLDNAIDSDNVDKAIDAYIVKAIEVSLGRI